MYNMYVNKTKEKKIMKLVNNIIRKSGVEFKKLPIGATYFDKKGVFCIKITNTECLFYLNDGSWEAGNELLNTLVQPLDTTIIIDGFKEI